MEIRYDVYLEDENEDNITDEDDIDAPMKRLELIFSHLAEEEKKLLDKYNFKYELCVVEENVYADKLNRQNFPDEDSDFFRDGSVVIYSILILVYQYWYALWRCLIIGKKWS